MRKNVKFFEWIKLNYFSKKARIEIVDFDDLEAKHLKGFALKVAETLLKNHPDLKILSFSRANCLWNFNHPYLALDNYGYKIEIPSGYDLISLKKTCLELELDENNSRIADIDVYSGVFEKGVYEKISRKSISGF